MGAPQNQNPNLQSYESHRLTAPPATYLISVVFRVSPTSYKFASSYALVSGRSQQSQCACIKPLASKALILYARPHANTEERQVWRNAIYIRLGFASSQPGS